MLRILGKKAQTTAEYAILIALIVGAVVAMQVYVKRGIQGRVRDVVDHTGASGKIAGEDFQFSTGQYEPYYNKSVATTTQGSESSDKTLEKGAAQRTSSSEVGVSRTAETTATTNQ